MKQLSESEAERFKREAARYGGASMKAWTLPPADWVERYEAANQGTCAPTAAFWFAYETVRQHYGIDHGVAMGPKMRDVECCHAWIVEQIVPERYIAGKA